MVLITKPRPCSSCSPPRRVKFQHRGAMGKSGTEATSNLGRVSSSLACTLLPQLLQTGHFLKTHHGFAFDFPTLVCLNFQHLCLTLQWLVVRLPWLLSSGLPQGSLSSELPRQLKLGLTLFMMKGRSHLTICFI